MKDEPLSPTLSQKGRGGSELTPLMQQYHEMKSRYPEELLFFRLGDFYELFDEDAKRAAPLLELALTHRQQAPMCGVPAHSVDPYIAKLLKAGLRVAIAEQMEDPSMAKGLVKRAVIRVMTAGTLQEETLLAPKRSNYLAALFMSNDGAGLAAIEYSTGEFAATEIANVDSTSVLWDEIDRLAPSELVIAKTAEMQASVERLRRNGLTVTEISPSEFALPIAQERLKKAFGVASLRGFGLENEPRAAAAAGAALHYLETTQCGRTISLQALRTYRLDDTLQMDAHTIDHLDLVGDASPHRTPRTLLDVIDQTLTPMGGRLLRRWLLAPLRRVQAIEERQRKVEFFVEQKESRRHLRTTLHTWPDLERILTRLTAGTVLPRDLSHLTQGLRRAPEIQRQLAEAHRQATVMGVSLPDALTEFLTAFPQESELADHLARAVVEAPPATMKDGGVICPGFSAELDEVRSWIHDGKTRLLEMEKTEREVTGIGSLKIGFNNVFGYFIEVTKTHLARVPDRYTRKQTMANGERYITQELKEYETRILGAEERALRLEQALVQALREDILKKTTSLRTLARAIAELDIFLSLADVAEKHRYTKPKIEDSGTLFIREGRHPILDQALPAGTFVANDVQLDAKDQIIVLTGPNMSGKSTYLRQTALIAVLAQMGSYVPAAEARLGVLDQLFTRIGASDRLMEGESTFMVEMVETARILRHATNRSLVILDEVGRGTSTYDGIAIAWACLEYLIGGPKVLFATHYFELTQLARQLPGIRNAHVSAREWGDHVVFLHKIEPGPADKAYGIHVARLAGVPKPVVDRATTLLRELEKRKAQSTAADDRQPDLFE